MKLYWTLWLILCFPVAFLIPEAIALKRGRPQDTLSWYFWHFEGLDKPGTSILQWSAAHFLFAGTLITFVVWFVGHILLKLWT